MSRIILGQNIRSQVHNLGMRAENSNLSLKIVGISEGHEGG
jgi:hypothetical protein